MFTVSASRFHKFEKPYFEQFWMYRHPAFALLGFQMLVAFGTIRAACPDFEIGNSRLFAHVFGVKLCGLIAAQTVKQRQEWHPKTPATGMVCTGLQKAHLVIHTAYIERSIEKASKLFGCEENLVTRSSPFSPFKNIARKYRSLTGLPGMSFFSTAKPKIALILLK